MVIAGGADERVATASCLWSVMVRARARLTNLIDGKIVIAVAG